jgi:rod shape-determining protein MreC
MALYGRRRSGEERNGARAVVVGLGAAMLGVLAIQTSTTIRDGIDISRRSMDGAAVALAKLTAGSAGQQVKVGKDSEAAARIAALQAEVAEMRRWKDLAETMAIRMQRYETLLNLVGETQAPAVTARVVAEERGPFAATRIANAGAAEGVREGFAAINDNGLIGRVIRVGEHTSRILLVTDFNSRIPVMGAKSGDRALLVGDSAGGARLTEAETPEAIVEGELWVTSGDDGQLPLGIRVGSAHLVNGEWRIQLSMEDGPVDFVRLSPPPDFAAPETAPVEPALQDPPPRPQPEGQAEAPPGGAAPAPGGAQ